MWGKRIFKGISLCLALKGVSHFCHQQTDGFTLSRIQSSLSYHPEWESGEAEPSFLKEILNQKFSYLGSGGQAFVFASEDGKYVLKFFKHYKRELPRFPLPSFLEKKRAESLFRKALKTDRDFKSYRLAFEELKEETGLVWIHLNKTEHLNTFTVLIDKIRIAHPLNLDNFEWILQKRGELLCPRIERLLMEEKKEEAEKALLALIETVNMRSQKGIADDDLAPHKNCAFVENRLIFIDVGKLRRTEEKKSIAPAMAKLSRWLEDKDPALAQTFYHAIHAEN